MNALQNSAHPSDELGQLASAFCDGAITADQLARLEAVLEKADERALWCVTYLRMHGRLLWQYQERPAAAGLAEFADAPAIFATDASGSPPVNTAAPQSPGTVPQAQYASNATRKNGWLEIAEKRKSLSILVGLVAVLVMLMTMAYLRAPQGTPKGPREIVDEASRPALVAHLTQTVDCRWVQGGQLAKGSPLHTGQTLQLREGFAQITYLSGAVALVEGPAYFTLDRRNGGRLDRGRIVARVEKPTAAGYSIATPHATIIDAGTEFGVEVDDDGKTDVVVIDGLVRVEAHDNDASVSDLSAPEQKSTTLPAGRSVTITPSGEGKSRLEYDGVAIDRFTRSLPEERLAQRGIVWDGTVSPLRAGFKKSFVGGPELESFWKFNSPEGFATQDTPYSGFSRLYELPQTIVSRELNNEAGWFVEFRLRVIDATHLRPDGYYFNVGLTLDDGKGLLQIGFRPQGDELEAMFNPPHSLLARSHALALADFHTLRVTRLPGNESSFEVQIDGGEPFTVEQAPTLSDPAGPNVFGLLSFGDITLNPGVGRAEWDYLHVNYEPEEPARSRGGGEATLKP